MRASRQKPGASTSSAAQSAPIPRPKSPNLEPQATPTSRPASSPGKPDTRSVLDRNEEISKEFAAAVFYRNHADDATKEILENPDHLKGDPKHPAIIKNLIEAEKKVWDGFNVFRFNTVSSVAFTDSLVFKGPPNDPYAGKYLRYGTAKFVSVTNDADLQSGRENYSLAAWFCRCQTDVCDGVSKRCGPVAMVDSIIAQLFECVVRQKRESMLLEQVMGLADIKEIAKTRAMEWDEKVELQPMLDRLGRLLRLLGVPGVDQFV